MHALRASHAELNGVYVGFKCHDTDTLGFDDDGSGKDGRYDYPDWLSLDLFQCLWNKFSFLFSDMML